MTFAFTNCFLQSAKKINSFFTYLKMLIARLINYSECFMVFESSNAAGSASFISGFIFLLMLSSLTLVSRAFLSFDTFFVGFVGFRN